LHEVQVAFAQAGFQMTEPTFDVELLALLWMNEIYDRRDDYDLFHADVEEL
jgi:hypothetical protein